MNILNRLLYSKLYSEESGGDVSGGGDGGGEIVDSDTSSDQVLDGGQDGSGGDIVEFGSENYLYAGKYKTTKELESGYKESVSMHTSKVAELNAEMKEKLGGFVGSPEGDYELPDGATGYSSPVMDAMANWGKENGLSQEAYSELIGQVASAETANFEAYRGEQMEILGKDAQIRIKNVNDKWAATFGADALGWMNEKAQSAADVEMFESILASQSGSQVNPDGGGYVGDVTITDAQLDEAMFAKDGQGNLKMLADPEYKKMVDSMTSKYNKQRGIA